MRIGEGKYTGCKGECITILCDIRWPSFRARFRRSNPRFSHRIHLHSRRPPTWRKIYHHAAERSS